ncbi:uncharacterized protein L199_000634 [Kwoniella botswanensis]|uniref:uncharacterized protein n=1 Tax=Kwoniella botswanensis TaxID=1268659 RepID=UPI00315DDA42
MECLKKCWSGRSRSNKPPTAKHSLQSLIEHGSDPERINDSVAGPYSATTAALYRGDGPIDGTDTKWTLSLLPKDQISAEAERYSWTIRAFEKDIKNLEGVEEGLKGPITTSSKLIRTVDPHVQKEFPHQLHMGFSRGDSNIYTEIGNPSYGPVQFMPWGTIMTKTNNIAALTTENRFPFHADQYSRILTGYENVVPHTRRRRNSTSEVDPIRESSILESLLQAEEADPRNAQPPMLKVTLAGYQTSDDTREHDTYDFRFNLADDVTEGNHPENSAIGDFSMSHFDKRHTDAETEDRFVRSFRTLLDTLKILSEDRCANVHVEYTTTDNFAVKVLGMPYQESGQQNYLVRMRDLETQYNPEEFQGTA